VRQPTALLEIQQTSPKGADPQRIGSIGIPPQAIDRIGRQAPPHIEGAQNAPLHSHQPGHRGKPQHPHAREGAGFCHIRCEITGQALLGGHEPPAALREMPDACTEGGDPKLGLPGGIGGLQHAIDRFPGKARVGMNLPLGIDPCQHAPFAAHPEFVPTIRHHPGHQPPDAVIGKATLCVDDVPAPLGKARQAAPIGAHPQLWGTITAPQFHHTGDSICWQPVLLREGSPNALFQVGQPAILAPKPDAAIGGGTHGFHVVRNHPVWHIHRIPDAPVIPGHAILGAHPKRPAPIEGQGHDGALGQPVPGTEHPEMGPSRRHGPWDATEISPSEPRSHPKGQCQGAQAPHPTGNSRVGHTCVLIGWRLQG